MGGIICFVESIIICHGKEIKEKARHATKEKCNLWEET